MSPPELWPGLQTRHSVSAEVLVLVVVVWKDCCRPTRLRACRLDTGYSDAFIDNGYDELEVGRRCRACPSLCVRAATTSWKSVDRSAPTTSTLSASTVQRVLAPADEYVGSAVVGRRYRRDVAGGPRAPAERRTTTTDDNDDNVQFAGRPPRHS